MRFSPSTFTTGMCCLILAVTNLKDQLREKLPQWYKDTENKYGLVLTDDVDSLLGCAILKAKMNWNIQEVMLFNARQNSEISVDWHGIAENATHEAIGVDFAKVNGKCFDNHVTLFNSDDTYNKEAINLNHIYGINRNSYTKKYNLSTALLLWSLYDLPKDNLPDELMMLLLCIDSSYYSYYHGFQRQNYRWIVDELDLPEFYECQKRHTEYDFIKIAKKYRVKEKIYIEDHHLHTNIDIDGINDLLLWDTPCWIELPSDKFYTKDFYKDITVNITDNPENIYNICDDPYCYAITRKNQIKYSERINLDALRQRVKKQNNNL